MAINPTRILNYLNIPIVYRYIDIYAIGQQRNLMYNRLYETEKKFAKNGQKNSSYEIDILTKGQRCEIFGRAADRESITWMKAKGYR